jgi:N-sulfoglucosamine sulfohydrolase
MKSLLPLLAALAAILPAGAADHPNILWLTCEDSNVSWFGCYGNPAAKTPNIDALAAQGFRYTHVYANAPVCAPQRSTWITGINAVSMGTQPMRSSNAIPHGLIKYYPDSLRAAGYFTANHTKTDYNIGGRPDQECWDSRADRAWELCAPGQPFFQVINFTQSHESSAHGPVENTRHDPATVALHKYHPDEPGIRKNYAKYYDAVEDMDALVGKALGALEKAGLAEETIVIFNSDHGGVMPRSKRFLYNSGVHAPLIVRLPAKFKHLWPAERPGMTVDRLVSFVDMPKTWLSLAGAEVPKAMQGRIFLGPQTEEEPPFVFAFRDRMDERIDLQRSSRDKQFVYIKNYAPYIPWGQHLEYLWKMVATQTWEAAFKAGRTNEVTGRFFTLKPFEELYDAQADPDNVVNLAEKPEHQQTLAAMRARLREWQLAVHDSGLIPEAERQRRANEQNLTIYEMVRDPKLYNLPAYLDAADLALAKEAANTPRLLEYLKSADSGLRYWGAVGLLSLGKIDAAAQAGLEAVLADPSGDVSATAAWALVRAGQPENAGKTLLGLLEKHDPATLMVLNIIDWSKMEVTPFVAAINALPVNGNATVGYEQRMVAWLRESHGLAVPAGEKPGARGKNRKAAGAQ